VPTVRSKEALLDLDDDVGEQKKTQDLLYDVIETIYGRIATRRSILDFDDSAGPGTTAALGAANTRAWENWVNNCGDPIYLPPDDDGFIVDHLVPPYRSVLGEGNTSKLVAASGFTPFSNTMFDLARAGAIGTGFPERNFGQLYSGFKVVSSGECLYTFGVDDELANFAGTHRFRNIQIEGATSYELFGVAGDEGSSPLVGAKFSQMSIRPSGGAGGISLGNACDDIEFDQLRLEMLGGNMTNVPILLNGTVNTSFKTPFLRNLTYHGS